MNNEQLTMKTKWVHKKLGTLGEIITGSTPPTSKLDYWNGEYNFYSPADFDDSVYCEKTERTVTKAGVDIGRYIPANSIMVACIASIGKIAISKTGGITNQQINTIVPYEEYDYKFLYYLLLLNTTAIKNKAAQTTIPIINKEDFSNLEFAVPDLSAQRRIAAILASADKVIAATQKLIAKYKQMKQGMMEDLLKPKEGCKTVKLGEVGEINPSNKRPVPNQFIYIDLESVIAGKLLFENYILKGNAPSRAQRLVDKNDVLYQTVRPYQRNNYIHKKQGNYVASTGYALIRCYDDYEPDFIFYLLHTHNFESVVLGLCTGTSYPAIAPNNLKRIEIAIPFKNDKPDLPEQRRIASILSGIDAKIALEEKVLEKYEKVKKGLMERMLEEKQNH